MIFSRYFLKRLLINVFAINIGLTLLFNLIEFFEKIVRFNKPEGSLEAILAFVAFNVVPSFFANLPVSSWLGSCMTIKELHQQNEWEVAKLLNIKTKHIFLLISLTGIGFMLMSFCGKEFCATGLEKSAEKIKQEKLKQNSKQKLFNKWFSLSKKNADPDEDCKKFCHFNYLDLATGKGSNLSIIELSNTFRIENITAAKSFSISAATKEITVETGKETSTKAKQQTLLTNKKIRLPSLFTQLQLQTGNVSLKHMFHVVIFDRKILPSYVYNQILYQFLHRIFIHLLLLIYPLLTFALFLLFPHSLYCRWILIFLPYPFKTVLLTATDSLFDFFQHGILAATPYSALIAITIAVYYAIRK